MKIYVLFLLALFICGGCKNQRKEEIKNEIVSRIGSRVILPDSLQYRSLMDSIVPIPEKSIKIVTFINGECFQCLNSFIEWKDAMHEFQSFNEISILFYVKTQDFKSLKKPLADIEFLHPFFIDPRSDILYLNHIPENQRLAHTFLLNKNNEIVLMGSPVNHPKLWELYKQQIRELTAQN